MFLEQQEDGLDVAGLAHHLGEMSPQPDALDHLIEDRKGA